MSEPTGEWTCVEANYAGYSFVFNEKRELVLTQTTKICQRIVEAVNHLGHQQAPSEVRSSSEESPALDDYPVFNFPKVPSTPMVILTKERYDAILAREKAHQEQVQRLRDHLQKEHGCKCPEQR